MPQASGRDHPANRTGDAHRWYREALSLFVGQLVVPSAARHKETVWRQTAVVFPSLWRANILLVIGRAKFGLKPQKCGIRVRQGGERRRGNEPETTTEIG
jgi:hypothetical protein